MRQAGEPSVEEILDSIKQVIARDNREIASVERKRRESGLDSDESEDEADEDVLDLAEAGEELIEESSGGGESGDPALVDAGAEESMRESLAALAMLAEPGQKPQIVRSGETSLEGLAREMMRPMLKEWLDKNLPAMVEQLVAAEIARIAGKKDR